MNLTPIQKLWIASWQTLSVILPKAIAQAAQILFLTPERIPRPPSEIDYFNSAKKYKIDDRIAAFEWGLPHNPLVLLVHGWSGRGDSAGQITHVGEYSQFMIDIQKTLGPYHAIIAHSFGAGCAVLSASRGLSVKKIVMVAGPSRYELVVTNYLDALKLSPKAREHFLNSLGERVKLPVADMNVGVIGNKLSHLKAMVVHDIEDKEVTVRAAEDIKKNWPSIEIMMTTGLGHRRILKDPTVTAAVTEFILKT